MEVTLKKRIILGGKFPAAHHLKMVTEVTSLDLV
jgi:hypothetical protein